MAITWDKLLALVVAAGYLIAAAVVVPALGMMIWITPVVLAPVALIWLPEYLGGSAIHRKKTVLGTYDEPGHPSRRPMRDSHPAVVRWMGWFLLVGLPALVIWLARSPGPG